MSVSTISNASTLSSVHQSRNTVATKIGSGAGSFASVLSNARQIDQVSTPALGGGLRADQGLGANSILNGNTSPFASTLSQAQFVAQANQGLPKVASQATNGTFGLADLYLYNSLNVNAAQGLSKVSEVQPVSETVALGNVAPSDQSVELGNLTLDFTALLPEGTKSLLQDLNCTEGELNSVINVMVFGSEQGPQGQNAAEFFGKSNMGNEELSSVMQDLLDKAHINTLDVTGQDYDFVLSNEGAALGQTLASERGMSLEPRAMERDLEATYEKDMALMQILSQSNNQSANIF